MKNMVTLNWKKKGLKKVWDLENGSRMSRECLENVSKTARRSRTNVGRGFARSLMLPLIMLLTMGIGSAWGDTSYYMFTPTSAPNPSHTGTFSGSFYGNSSSASSTSRTINGYTMNKGYKLSTQTSLGAYYYGKDYTAYDIKTTSTQFTIYYYNNASSAKNIYYVLIPEGQSSAPSPVTIVSASASSGNYATFTINSTKNTRIAFYSADASNVYCYQIVAVEKGSALLKPGEIGYKIGFKGVYSRFTDYSAGTSKEGSTDDSLLVKCYSNYKANTTDAIKVHNTSDYISFRTGAYPCRVKVWVSSSKTYYVTTNLASGTDNSSTSTQVVELSANTRYYIKGGGSDATIDSIVFSAIPYSVTHTLTNVTKSSGATGAGAAQSGSAYNAVFAAADGYSLPDDITVTIGGAAATAGTDYTWNSSTGAFQVPAAKVTGAIAVTIAGESAGCTSYSFHYGTRGSGGWLQECFVEPEYGVEHEMQVENFTIPSTPHFYVGKAGVWDATHAADRACSTDAGWDDLYFAKALYPENAAGSPKVGAATGAVGKLRIYDNSTWNNKQIAFLPDGYVLKFNTTEKAFRLWGGDTFISEAVEYNGTSALYPVSVGVANSSGGFVSTNNTEAMKHIFLNTGGSTYWEADGVSNFALYDITNSYFPCLMTKVPGIDNLYEGWVVSSCTQVIFVRLKSSTVSWDNKYDQTPDLTLPANKNLFTITSWSNGTWSALSRKGKFKMDANYTDKNFYVRFVPGYTITYAKGTYGTGSTVEDVKAHEENVTLRDDATLFTREGYELTGWSTSAGGGTKNHNLGASYTTNANLSLYPYWTVKNYDLTWNLGGGTTTSAGTGIASGVSANTTSSVAYGTSLTAPTVTKTGYNFSAWSPSVASTMPAAATTYTATWTAKQCTINFDNEGGTGGTSTVTATYGSALPSKASNLPTKDGYTFEGYWDGDDGTGTQYYNADGTSKKNWDKDVTADQTLYAKWTLAAVCGISSCGNATLTYEISASTSSANTAANLVSSATASNTTALGVPAASSAATLSTMVFDGNNGKAVAKENACYTTSLIMSSKLSVHNGSSFNTSHYLQFAFTVKAGYSFTPCDIQFVVQPTSYATDFRWEITDGTNTYGYGTESEVGTGSSAGATVLTGLTSPSIMLPGTYYIRLYPKFNKSGKTNDFRIADDVILKGTTAAIPQYTITLDDQDADTGYEGTSSFTVHLGCKDYDPDGFDMPYRAANPFGGYYTAVNGGGVQVIKKNGTINAGVAGYTDASSNWIYEGNTTLYAYWADCADYTFHTASSGSHPWKPYTCFEQVGETNEWRITNYTIPSATKFYVGYQGLDAAKTAECAWATTPTQSAGVWQGQMVLLPEGSSVLGVGQATGATGKLVMWDNSTHKNYYVGFQPSGYGLTYAAGVEAFSLVSNHLWQTDIVTLTAADVAGTFKVGLETATPGTYADCAQTSSYTSTQMNSHKDELVSGQSYPAIPDLAAGQEGRFVIWDNSDGQWWLSFLPVYTVQYNANGGTGSAPAAATKYRTNEQPTVLGNTFTAPTDHVFTGWNTAAGGGGDSYAAGDELDPIGANVTLYAQWHELETYNITYHLNGASWVGGYTAPATYKEGTGATLPVAGNMTNVGYTFDGWYANEELTGGVKTSIGTAEAGDKEFWAKWTENTYTVTYDANGGTGSISNTVGHYVTLSDNTYTKSGYAFSDWNTAADGSGISYHEGEEIELTADLDLYAIWATDYTITWGNVQIAGAGATVTPNLGGGNYTITASVSDWTGTLTAAMLTAETAGLTITNVTVDNSASPKTITATFSVGATVAGDTVALLLSLPAAGVYGAKDSEKVIDIERCDGATVVWDFNSMSATDFSTSSPGTEGNKNSISASTGSGTIYYFAGSSDAIKSWSKGKPVVLYLGGTAGSGSVGGNSTYTNRCFYIDITSNGTLTITNHEDQNGAPSYQVTGAIRPGTSGYSSVSAKGSGSDAYVYEITVDSYNASTANRIWVAYTSSKAYINNITWTPSGGSGTITPTLTWSPALASGATVDKYDTDGDFTYAASTTSNTLGTITYTSSDATVATVNSSGKVHILKSGVTTITATLAESGCYESAAITYTLNVISTCADVAGTLSATNLGCDGIQLTVSGHTEDEGVTVIKWYKDGVWQDNASYNNNATVTVTAAGEWYAQTTAGGVGHCVRNSNSITVAASESVTASKIVDEWYVKNGRRTPDVALVQTANAVNFSVAFANAGTKIWDSSTGTPVTTGFGGCDFHINESTGVIYLNGSSSAGAAPTGMTVGDTTITITAQGCGSSASVTIRLHVQDATTYKTIAYVVDGTKGGAWDAVTSGHADGTQLYEYLDSVGTGAGARKFMLSERNIYKTVDEKLIREHYSQFDAILITDDPNTSTMDGKKSYVDAFGTMIDVRPLLTMEAFVSKLANWSCVKGSPTSPNPRQYTMRLQCKDHEIYSGLPAPATGTHVWSETIDGDEYRFVIMVDSTKSPYEGVGATSETSDKPALQGFSSAAMGDLLGLGVISNGALQAGIERQEEPAARMMILGINNKALPNALTDEGKKVIENALTYLLKTNMEEVDDCSNFFKGGTAGHETDWNTTTNWQKGTLPTFETKVRILAPCEVSGITPRVAQVDIAASGTSSKIKGGICSGSLTIKPDGGLIVAGKVRSAVAPYFNNSDLNPTTPAILTIEANSTNTGALILDNSDGTTQATVEMYSKSYWEIVAGKKKKYWSYVGVPITDVDIPNYFYLGFTYLYDETTGWIKKGDGSVLQPFEGIGLAMQTGHKETFQGTLASTETQEIALTKTTSGGNGENLIGNSWTAPIQITAFEDSDFGGAEATVSVYNSGRDDVAHNPTYVTATEENDGAATAGQWLSVPISVSKLGGYTGLKVIPAMQAFQVTTGSATTLTLDYDKLVRPATNTVNAPMRAPKRKAPPQAEIEGLLRVRVSGETTHTDVWLLKDERFDYGFDNGWEASYQECDERSAQLYALSEIGKMAFLAQPEIDGTVLGFAPSRDGDEYTFSFHYLGNETLYLNDLKQQSSTLISEENIYRFTYEEGDTHRFLISATPFGAPGITTGVSETGDGARVQKIIYRDHVYIIRGGRIYDVVGKVVK